MNPPIKDIQNQEITFPPTIQKVDWGSKARGQGKRSAGMVRGAMSDAPTGIKEYENIFGNLPDYEDIKDDLIVLEWWQEPLYMKCRSYGMNHDESLDYVLEL